MKEAISIYLGGQVIDAADCNYESAKNLGLKCPFCDSAVFLRSHSVRRIKGKDKIFGAYFSHYSCGNGESLECEKRSISKQGKEQIERIKIERRNQRLQLYNRFLWDMIADDIGFKPKHFAEVRKLFGDQWVENLTLKVRREWTGREQELFQMATDILQKYESMSGLEFLKGRNLIVHQAIINEVISFLLTNTGGYALIKVIKAGLLSSYYITPGVEKVWKRKDMQTVFIWLPVMLSLCAVDWTKQFYKFISPEQRGHWDLI